MVRDALNAIDRGYDCLKVKVGKEPEKDIARLSAIRGAVPKDCLLYTSCGSRMRTLPRCRLPSSSA